MNELKKIVKDTSQRLGIAFTYYEEKRKPTDAPVCEKPFEDITDDGEYTFFRFLFKGVGYVGALVGVGEMQRNYAALLPSYIESFVDKETELSKTEYLKRILLGECSSLGVYRYASKFSVRDAACYALAIRVKKMLKETLGVIEQYGGNSLDTAVQITDELCALVRFISTETEDGYRSSVDYAEFLAQSLKEELGLDELEVELEDMLELEFECEGGTEFSENNKVENVEIDSEKQHKHYSFKGYRYTAYK